MLNFNTLVIGGGIAGFCAAIRRAQLGHSTALISQGESSLHFASGSIDLLANHPHSFAPVTYPMEAIANLPSSSNHPYRKIGAANTAQAMTWFTELMHQQDIHFHQQQHQQNHWRITPFGTLKATWLSQQFSTRLSQVDNPNFERVIVVGIEGFRDFQPAVTVDNLRRLPQFHATPIQQMMITLPSEHNANSLRSKRAIDYARALRDPTLFALLRDQLLHVATPRDLVILPAIFGNGDGQTYIAQLQQQTQLQFHEVPTTPPSLLGIRIADALQRAFVQAGGTLLKGDCVTRATFSQSKNGNRHITQLFTRNIGDMPLTADNIILSSGSFFSRGLIATADSIQEPIFNLDIDAPASRKDWYGHHFFDSHPYIRSGVITDDAFIPAINGEPIVNLQCIGGVMSGFDPVKEGSGGGISIASGYRVAELLQPQRAPISTTNSEVAA